jgi:hypothetical protein
VLRLDSTADPEANLAAALAHVRAAQ